VGSVPVLAALRSGLVERELKSCLQHALQDFDARILEHGFQGVVGREVEEPEHGPLAEEIDDVDAAEILLHVRESRALGTDDVADDGVVDAAVSHDDHPPPVRAARQRVDERAHPRAQRPVCLAGEVGRVPIGVGAHEERAHRGENLPHLEASGVARHDLPQLVDGDDGGSLAASERLGRRLRAAERARIDRVDVDVLEQLGQGLDLAITLLGQVAAGKRPLALAAVERFAMPDEIEAPPASRVRQARPRRHPRTIMRAPLSRNPAGR
jgi:hypothetical protein